MKVLIVGPYDLDKVKLLNPNQHRDYCFPDDGTFSTWDVDVDVVVDAARVQECDMLVAFWDGRDAKVQAWISRAKIAEKTTLIFYK